MDAMGAVFFIVIIGSIVIGIGIVLEILMCRIEKPAAKFILPIAGILLWLLCGIVTKDFTGGGAAIFGIISIGAVIGLILKLIFRKRKAK
ncbi:MAG: hypothetical protein IKJ57_06765 [Oscillospiraceae bacterium]|nr:hypothetical protein [Oscillospiraceae bacterium]